MLFWEGISLHDDQSTLNNANYETMTSHVSNSNTSFSPDLEKLSVVAFKYAYNQVIKTA